MEPLVAGSIPVFYSVKVAQLAEQGILVGITLKLNITMKQCYINTGNDLPGIVGLFRYDPGTAQIFCQLAERLLQDDHIISKGGRELIAAYVSKVNNCDFCYNSHRAISEQLNNDIIVKDVLDNNDLDCLPESFKALLKIAEALARNVQGVTSELVQEAYKHGATEEEVHRTVQITAAFCMYNRYVDGCGTHSASSKEEYVEMAKDLVENGYLKVVNQA